MSTALLPEPSLRRALGDPMLPLRATVRRRRRELADTWTLELDVADGRLGRFEPGQFNMLWAFGVGEAAISISGDPAADGPLVHTIRDVGKVSGALARLRVGDSLGIRGPFGTAWPVEAAYGRDVVVVAGGLGLAPLRPAIYQLFRERHRFGRISILYGTRNPAQILYPAELERWRRRLDVEIAVTVDHADTDWRGNVGVVTKLIERAGFDPSQALALLCGPEVMMRFAAVALSEMGLPDDAMHVSLERHMKCALGHCGRCQFGPTLLCRDGPVLSFDRVARLLPMKEI
ncbi:MAG: FAD/NAD(P)-binding protein [Geminicoccaceae bacterium]